MKIRLRPFAVAGLVCMSIFLSGCGATAYKADPKLIGQYVAPSTPGPDETHVYVIRGSNFVGAARSAWIAANERVVGAVDNASHVLLKLKSGTNTVHAVQGLAGFGFVAIDNRPGETVFLSLDYAKGLMQEVPRDVGITMVMQTKASEPLAETRENTGYEEGLLNPGRLGLKLMGASNETLAADAKSAVITFMRPAALIKEIAFDVWDESGYVGSLKGGEYFQIRVAPGAHTYFAKSERFAVLKANVEAGKSYFVEYNVTRGWNMAHVQLLPRDATKEDAALKKQMTPLTRVALQQATLAQPSVKARLDAGSTYLINTREKVLTGETASRELTSGMGM